MAPSLRFVPLGILLASAAFLGSLDAMPVRQAVVVGMGECSIRQIESLPARVDFVALGSSRVRAGISTEAIARASGGDLSDNFNFGRSGLSALRSYITYRDILDRGIRPRYVFMEVDLEALLDTDASAPIPMPGNAAIMTYADAASVTEAHPELNALQRLRLQWLTWLDKVRGSIIPVLSLDPIRGLLQHPREPTASCQGSADFQRTAEGNRTLERLRREMNSRGLAGSANVAAQPAASLSARRQQELFYVRKVGELARVHGATMLVARHGRAYELPMSAEAVASIRQDIPQFVQPPDSLIRATWPDYLDATHMGPNARDRYSAWLADHLLGDLAR